MPRRQRLDIVPTIELEDLRQVRTEANQLAERHSRLIGVHVYLKNRRPVSHYRTYAPLEDAFSISRENLRKHNSFEILYFIASKFEVAETSLVDPPEQNIQNSTLLTQFRLTVVGCRARLTNKQIARGVGLSDSTVERAIHNLKEAEIIVNWGRGWIEVNSDMMWRGGEDIRVSYSKVQKLHPRHPHYFTFVDDC